MFKKVLALVLGLTLLAGTALAAPMCGEEEVFKTVASFRNMTVDRYAIAYEDGDCSKAREMYWTRVEEVNSEGNWDIAFAEIAGIYPPYIIIASHFVWEGQEYWMATVLMGWMQQQFMITEQEFNRFIQPIKDLGIDTDKYVNFFYFLGQRRWILSTPDDSLKSHTDNLNQYMWNEYEFHRP